jgi:hypothetical protein
LAPISKISPVPPQTITSSPSKAVLGTAQTRHWPQFSDFDAYQNDEFSQLRSAREIVEAKLAETHDEPVRVAFLDTGYDSKHIARPHNVNKELARNFVEDETNPDGISLDQQPGLAGSQSHGTGTIGILAGDLIELDGIGDKAGFSGPLGGAPFAEIAPMRVATSVVHLENPFIKTRPSGTTRAILYAIRNKCDVISMSHGGLPSRALAEAINAAYEAGIAMFFASGDYLQPENLGVVHSPRYVVYPAAFSRAMCVCGVTADYKTYGKPPSDHYDPSLGFPASWRLRGNWGPATWMKNAIAAFSPNIPWAHLPQPNSHEGENVIDLDGQGTSASTPQAAAAAVLWLQYYRSDSDLKSIWRSWKKPELVYMALRRSAREVQDPATPDYSQTFFGAGVLQAKEALAIAPGRLYPVEENEASVGLGWMRLFASVIGGTRAEGVSEDTLKQMFGLELAQIAQRSPQVQDIMQRYGGYDPDAEDNPPTGELANFKKELFNAIKDDNRVSQHLRDAIRNELGTP